MGGGDVDAHAGHGGDGGRRGHPYPRFSGDEMGNLVGFLKHTAAAPSPAPDAREAEPVTPGCRAIKEVADEDS